jgi:uncharacterized phage protein (TIGR01671 family)
MREIKYQAWLGHTLVQVTKMDFMKNTDGLYVNNGQGYFLDGENRGTHTGFKMSEVKFRQSTGLLDKNGKEIYEYDIVKTFDQENLIDFEGGAFRVKGLHEDRYERTYSLLSRYLIDVTIPDMPHSNYDGLTTTLEVIGNIFEGESK